MKRVAGYLFHQDDNHRLIYRKSWWSYAIGCFISAAVFLTVLLFLLNRLSDRTIYVGSSRGFRGTPVAPSDQTWRQVAESTGCTCLFFLPFLLVPVAYILGGSEEQRNPFIFDRQRDRVSYGRKEVCRMSAIVAIRLVEASGGRAGRRGQIAGRTGIFARLNGSPWSIELGCFNRFRTAQRFAEEISGFLNVGLYDDPLIPRPQRGPGFEVIPRPTARPKLPGDES